MRKIKVVAKNGDSYTFTSKWTSEDSIKIALNVAKDDQFVSLDGLVIRKSDVVTVQVAEEGEEWHETV